jgi:hypothetical protein
MLISRSPEPVADCTVGRRPDTGGMRHLASPGWVVLGASGLASYVALVVVFLAWTLANSVGGSELAGLNRVVALIVLIAFVLPTIVLAALLFVRRVARIVAVAAVGWMLLTAYLWVPVQAALAGWAVAVAILLVVAVLLGRSARQVGSTRSRPQR